MIVYLANPPFNDSAWFRKDDDVRFSSLSASNGERAGVRCRNDLPPKGNANFAWVQHFIHHLAPQGMAGLNAVRKDLANGRMSSNQSGEGDTRRAFIEADREMRNNEIRTTNRAFPTSTFELPPSKLAAPLPGRLFYCRPKVDRTDGFHRTQRHPTTASPSIR